MKITATVTLTRNATHVRLGNREIAIQDFVPVAIEAVGTGRYLITNALSYERCGDDLVISHEARSAACVILPDPMPLPRAEIIELDFVERPGRGCQAAETRVAEWLLAHMFEYDAERDVFVACC